MSKFILHRLVEDRSYSDSEMAEFFGSKKPLGMTLDLGRLVKNRCTFCRLSKVFCVSTLIALLNGRSVS